MIQYPSKGPILKKLLVLSDFETLTVGWMRGFFDTFAHFSHWIVHLTEK